MKIESPIISHSFRGYKKSDGTIATANYWVFMPTVFCENRNLDVIKESLTAAMGFARPNPYAHWISQIRSDFKDGKELTKNFSEPLLVNHNHTSFNSIDGLRFLNHEGGCGGTRQDATALGKLLASYADHPNVSGISILSLGCQHLQVENLMAEIQLLNPEFQKPVLIFEQQKSVSEDQFIAHCIRDSFVKMAAISSATKEDIPIQQLKLALIEPVTDNQHDALKLAAQQLDSFLTSISIEHTLVSHKEASIAHITQLVSSGIHMVLDFSGSEFGVGNPLCPVIRITEEKLVNPAGKEQYDLILDSDASQMKLEELSLSVFQYCCNVINGEIASNSMRNHWWDFMPLKCGVSL